MTTWTTRLVGDFPSDKLDCIPFVPHYWGNSITAWQNKEVIPIGIKDVHAAGLDGKHYLLKTHDPSLARNMQRTLDGHPGDRTRGDIFIIKVSGFPGSTYMKYGHVSTFLPTSTVAIEMLRAIRREPIEAPWSGIFHKVAATRDSRAAGIQMGLGSTNGNAHKYRDRGRTLL